MSAGTTQYCGLWKMRSMSCCNSPARSKYLRNWIERGTTETVLQDECEDLYAGAGNCTGCPVPDTCLVNTLETGLNIATILLAILGAEHQLHRTPLLSSVLRHPRELCVGVRVVSLRLHQVRQPADHACLHGHQVYYICDFCSC